MKTIKFSLILLAFMAFAQTTWAQLPCLPDHGRDDDVTAWCGETQTLELSAGWNWVSFYVEADDLLEQLEASLGENGLMIEGLSGTAVNLGDDFWLNDGFEDGILPGHMYMVQAGADCTVAVSGMVANASEVVIAINPGWNWIGFPCAEETEIAAALADFDAEEEDMIEGVEGTVVYLGDGFWLGEDMEVLKPGQGYFYKSNSDLPKTLVFVLGAKRR